MRAYSHTSSPVIRYPTTKNTLNLYLTVVTSPNFPFWYPKCYKIKAKKSIVKISELSRIAWKIILRINGHANFAYIFAHIIQHHKHIYLLSLPLFNSILPEKNFGAFKAFYEHDVNRFGIIKKKTGTVKHTKRHSI